MKKENEVNKKMKKRNKMLIKMLMIVVVLTSLIGSVYAQQGSGSDSGSATPVSNNIIIDTEDEIDQFRFGETFSLKVGEIAFVGDYYGEYHVSVSGVESCSTPACEPNNDDADCGKTKCFSKVRVNWRDGGEDYSMDNDGDKVDVNDHFTLILLGVVDGKYKFTTKVLDEPTPEPVYPHYKVGDKFKIKAGSYAILEEDYKMYVSDSMPRCIAPAVEDGSSADTTCYVLVQIQGRQIGTQKYMDVAGDEFQFGDTRNGVFLLELEKSLGNMYYFELKKGKNPEPIPFPTPKLIDGKVDEIVKVPINYAVAYDSEDIKIEYSKYNSEICTKRAGGDSATVGTCSVATAQFEISAYYPYHRESSNEDSNIPSRSKIVKLEEQTSVNIGNNLLLYLVDADKNQAVIVLRKYDLVSDETMPSVVDDTQEEYFYACAPGCKEVENGCLCPRIRVQKSGQGFIVSGSGASDIVATKLSIGPGDKAIRAQVEGQSDMEIGVSNLKEGIDFPVVIGGVQRIIKISTSEEKLESYIEEQGTNIKAMTREKIVGSDNGLAIKTDKEELEIKILPSAASETARRVLGEKFEDIELIQKDNSAIYKINGNKNANVLGFIPVEFNLGVEIDAESGDVLREDKPWYHGLLI